MQFNSSGLIHIIVIKTMLLSNYNDSPQYISKHITLIVMQMDKRTSPESVNKQSNKILDIHDIQKSRNLVVIG